MDLSAGQKVSEPSDLHMLAKTSEIASRLQKQEADIEELQQLLQITKFTTSTR